MEQWAQAAKLLHALPAVEKKRPEIRYIRARVALELDDHERALTLLEGLESSLQLMAADIESYRAEAQLHAGQHEQAARFFARQSGVGALTKAALAWSRAGKPKQARATIDEAIRQARKRVDPDVVRARRIRARFALASGDTTVAIVDLRFVAKHAKDPTDAKKAVAQLRKLAPEKRQLTSREHMQRARRHARDGDPEQVEREVARARTARGGPPSKTDELLARARARYRSRQDYAGAAQLYERLAGMKGGHVPQSMYFAAKAWTRADDNERGVVLYARLIKKFPHSPWSERASYYSSRLRRLQAQWKRAAKGYEAYLKRYPRGKFSDEAKYELALCHLLGGKPDSSLRALERLARDARDSLDAAASKHLVAVAAHACGKEKRAARIWRSIVKARPLSFFALASTARLSDLDQPSPPPLPPPPSIQAKPLKVTLPPAVQLLRGIGLDHEAEGILRTMEGAIDEAYGDRGGEALCRAYGQLGTGRRLHRIGQRHVPVRLVMMASSPATRWAWECLYPRPYRSMVSRLEARENLPQGLLFGVMRQESAFNPDALSPVGARGLMQLMPATGRKTARRMTLAVDSDEMVSPGVNLRVGAHYLGMLLRMMKGSVPLAAGSYNAGPNAVGRWVERTGDVPLDVWVALVPYRETRRYIWRVTGNWARYRYVEGGLAAVPKLVLEMPEGIKVPDDAY